MLSVCVLPCLTVLVLRLAPTSRLLVNPTYYGLEDASNEGVKEFMGQLIDDTLGDLKDAGCVQMGTPTEEGVTEAKEDPNPSAVTATTLGFVASYYYLNYATVGLFSSRLGGQDTVESLCRLLADAKEFAELPGALFAALGVFHIVTGALTSMCTCLCESQFVTTRTSSTASSRSCCLGVCTSVTGKTPTARHSCCCKLTSRVFRCPSRTITTTRNQCSTKRCAS